MNGITHFYYSVKNQIDNEMREETWFLVLFGFCLFVFLNQNEPDSKALLNKQETSLFYSPDPHVFYGGDSCNNIQDALCDASLKKYCNAWGHTT